MTPAELAAACALDAVLGDPRWLPHPVRAMGRTIVWYERWIRRSIVTPFGLRIAGLVLAGSLPLLTYLLTIGIIELAGLVHAWVGMAVEVFLAATALAARDLADHALAVRKALEASLEQARAAVSRIVGRDTDRLTEPEVVRAAVETVAESTSDGVVAPLFYLTIGGPPLALAYKAVSTLDSMVGHRDDRYRDFGWASARLDDVANWVPARLTAMLLVLAAALRFRTGRQAWTVLRRDRHKHASPNSGWPEAAIAGALRVQLGGINEYDGVPEEHHRLGDPVVTLGRAHITDAVMLMWTAALLAVQLAMGLRAL